MVILFLNLYWKGWHLEGLSASSVRITLIILGATDATMYLDFGQLETPFAVLFKVEKYFGIDKVTHVLFFRQIKPMSEI